MSDSSVQVHPLLKRLTIACCVVALLPITMGSMVTTLGAGMAFADWPSSDGQNMLLYPWLNDFRLHPDKFVEHGHRLAGVLIGLLSIALTVVAFRTDRRRWVRGYSVAILVAVIAQGLLGGARVLLNQQTLAMTHSITGALFFVTCLMFVVLSGQRWQRLDQQSDDTLSAASFGLIVSLPMFGLGQYILGGAFRHLHTMLDEHLVGAAIVGTTSFLGAMSLLRSESSALNRCGRALLAVLCLQILLGFAAYVTRLGFQTLGIVAVAGSTAQTVFCSLHTVGGMLLLSAAVVSSVSALKIYRSGGLKGLRTELTLPQQLSSSTPTSLSRDGGAA
ncbi:MAG: COX15/CtaA family protein [Planctomycetaceae bacterium]|nr:COX15/CtaA family protein [Planctomycetaceae bacterium]